MTLEPKLVVEDLTPLQAKILKLVGKMLRIPGNAFVCFIEYRANFDSRVEPTINDLIRSQEESETNSVRENNN